MMATKTMTESDWYTQADLSQYSGQWVVIFENSVVAAGKSLKELLKEFNKKFPGKKPFVAKIPTSAALLW